MKTMLHCVLLTLVLGVSLAGNAQAQPSAAASGPSYLGPDGELLPFTSHEEIVKFLRSARIVEHRELSSGSTRPLKVKLRRKGVEANAIFRSVDIKKRSASDSSGRHQFRDSHSFEVAAYELSRLLGLDSVPPVVEREYDDRKGSLQLWVEQTRSETDRIEKGERHPDADRIHLQMMSMRVFDNLIYNFDRNTGNILVDERGKLWWIDHTRSFKRLPALLMDNTVTGCDRYLWQRLQELDGKEVRRRLKPYLDSIQIKSLLDRRKKLIKHIEGLIAEEGESTVLFESPALDTPKAASASSK